MKSTRELYDKLSKSYSLDDYVPFYHALQKKYVRVKKEPFFALPKPETISDMGALLANLNAMDIEQYFASIAQVKFLHGELTDIVWDGNAPLHVQRSKDRIAFFNPHVQKLQVWYDPRILEYKKHEGRKKGDVSYYFGNREALEREAFAKGKLWLDPRKPDTRMYAYYEFDHVIGKSLGKEVSTLYLQIDRMRRPKGYFCGLHGHPRTLEKLKLI